MVCSRERSARVRDWLHSPDYSGSTRRAHIVRSRDSDGNEKVVVELDDRTVCVHDSSSCRSEGLASRSSMAGSSSRSVVAMLEALQKQSLAPCDGMEWGEMTVLFLSLFGPMVVIVLTLATALLIS